MHYAVIADIHSNLAALTAVLDDIEQKGGVDEIWCLGDIVGYGPDPHQCIELLRHYKHICVAGNHDWAAIGKVDTNYFNQMAIAAIKWTSEQLTISDRLYLENLPQTIDKGDIILVHGSPTEPLWEYVISIGIAERNFAHFESQFCLVGHSHVPEAFKLQDGACQHIHFSEGIGMVLGKSRMIINPGAVGQPRDGNAQASYAIYDTEGRMMRLHRVSYDIKSTQDKMMQAGLPVQLVSRLEAGK
jgi:predicted phosphodiesterase